MPPEYLCGLPIIITGGLAFFCSSYDWYWELMDHWKTWNTPAGRLFTKCVSLVCVMGGVGIVTGMITP